MTEHDLYRLACGVVLAKLRKRARLSQSELAAQVALTQVTISHFESGTSAPTIWTWRQLARSIGLAGGGAALSALVEQVLERAEQRARSRFTITAALVDWWVPAALTLGSSGGLRGLLAEVVVETLATTQGVDARGAGAETAPRLQTRERAEARPAGRGFAGGCRVQSSAR